MKSKFRSEQEKNNTCYNRNNSTNQLGKNQIDRTDTVQYQQQNIEFVFSVLLQQFGLENALHSTKLEASSFPITYYCLLQYFQCKLIFVNSYNTRKQ